MKVRDLLTDETKWAKGRSACDKGGETTPYDAPNAVAWCLAGAITRCYEVGEAWDTLATRAYDVLRARGQLPLGGIGEWNDSPARTFTEVRALVEELDI